MRNDLFGKAIRAELPYWPDVHVDFSTRGRHREANFTFKGQSRFIIIPTSTRDPVRAPKNAVAQMRETLRELGAVRRMSLPVSKREREEEAINMAPNAPVRMGITDDRITVTIPKTSPLYGKFADDKDRPTGHWSLELRSNPAPNGDPFVALVKKELPKGMRRMRGAVGGVFNAKTSAFQIAFAAGSGRDIVEKFGKFRTTEVGVRDDKRELLISIPTERKGPVLRGDKRLEVLTAPPPPQPEPVIEPEPVAEAPQPVIGTEVLAALLGKFKMPDKMALQLPERPLTVERCIAYLNKRVSEKGKANLRFHLDHETGFISYIEKGGPQY